MNRLKLQKQVQEMPLKGKGRGDSKTVINDELLGRNLILFVRAAFLVILAATSDQKPLPSKLILKRLMNLQPISLLTNEITQYVQ